MSSALYGLTLRPEWQERVRAEVSRVMGSRPTHEMTAEDLKAMTYTNCVWKEALRLWPAAVGTGRMSKADTTVGGYSIKKGCLIGPSFWSLHRNPYYWPRADDFLPERWLPENAAALGPKSPDAFMPFSVGPHACLGANLANAEGPALIAGVIRQVAFTAKEGWEPEWVQTLTLSSKTGVQLVPSRAPA